MKHITYSAPGKVILSGEHAVVYGKPALVSAIDLRLTFSIWESKKSPKNETIQFITQTVKEYLKKKQTVFPIFDFSIKSNIPIGYGLGSSAALSTAAVAACLDFYTGETPKKEIINNLAFKIEKKFHTNPSGVDNSTSCFGGLIFFRREFEFLKTISALTIRIPKKIEEHLFLIDSGKPSESTGDMVSYIGRKYNENSQGTEKLFSTIEKITKRLVISLVKEDASLFKKTIDENEVLLEELGVVSLQTKKIIADLKQYNSCKITGAGGIKKGSGYLMCLAEDHEKLEKYAKQSRLSFMHFKQDFEGVKKI